MISVYIIMKCLGCILLMEILRDYKVEEKYIIIVALFWEIIAITTIAEILVRKITGNDK
jgi:hypothetical protein